MIKIVHIQHRVHHIQNVDIYTDHKIQMTKQIFQHVFQCRATEILAELNSELVIHNIFLADVRLGAHFRMSVVQLFKNNAIVIRITRND